MIDSSRKPWLQEGLRRYRAGEPLRWSTAIDGDPSWGYGDLDTNGYWQFGVPFDALNEHDQETVKLALGVAQGRRSTDRRSLDPKIS